MTETEFLELAEKLMSDVETAIDSSDIDVDCDRSGNVLTLEADSGEQVVINLHGPTQQVWLASRKGGLHFSYTEGKWIGSRDGIEFFKALEGALSFITGEEIEL